MQVHLLLVRAIGRSSSDHSESIVVSLESIVDIFSPICGSKIRIVKDVSTGAVEVCFMKTLIDFPNR